MGDMLTAGWKMIVVRGHLVLSAALSILLGILFVADPGAAGPD